MRLDRSDLEADPARVAAAVRGPARPLGFDPGPVHRHVGCLTEDTALSRRAALAAAARSRGETAPASEKLRRAREELVAMDPPAVDGAPAREAVSSAAEEVRRLRERVATLRGRLQARRESGPADAAAERFRDAARELSEVETEHAAARERLAAARDRARTARDERERRLRLEDRIGNLERRERAQLAATVRPAVEATVTDVPGADVAGLADADDLTAALAVARVADLSAPVVVACGRFDGVHEAAAWLDAPVVWL